MSPSNYNYNIPDHMLCEDRAFLDAIENGTHTKTHIENILESAKLLDALYQSAEKKEEIKL